MDQQSKRDHWANILDQQKESNLSIKQFCIDNEISYQTLYYWSKKLSESEVTTKIHPIIVTEPTQEQSNIVVLTLNNGLRAELPANLNSKQIKHWVDALQ